MRLPVLAAAAALTVLVTAAPSALAGPTVSADLDLGTSIGRDLAPSPGPSGAAPTSLLYIAGFRIRAGWRFSLGPLLLVPEIGGGYDVQRFSGAPDGSLPRVFVGGRGGLSLPVLPLVRFEPGLYGHIGYAPGTGPGLANDVGLALDLRLLRFLLVGAHVGYEVVTRWLSAAPFSSGTVAIADRWIGYGVHAGVVF